MTQLTISMGNQFKTETCPTQQVLNSTLKSGTVYNFTYTNYQLIVQSGDFNVTFNLDRKLYVPYVELRGEYKVRISSVLKGETVKLPGDKDEVYEGFELVTKSESNFIRFKFRLIGGRRRLENSGKILRLRSGLYK